jgi:predicted porin
MRTTATLRVGVLLSGILTGFNSLSASAAEFDLDQRLADLEQTAVRSGSRRVSVQVYGQVNYALLSWNDGVTSDTYVVDNDTSSTRLGLIGQGRIGNGTVAGYRLEMEFRGAASAEVDAKNDNFGDDQTIRLRHAHWFIEDVKLGRLTLGQQSPATDDITIISLGARMSDAPLHYNNAFQLRFSPAGPAGNPVFKIKWGDLAHTVDSMRGNFVRYDTPTVKGFLLSAAAGEDDVWDVALRYSDGPDWLRMAGGIGYMDNSELGIRDLRGSFSALHTPTGLFATIAGGCATTTA